MDSDLLLQGLSLSLLGLGLTFLGLGLLVVVMVALERVFRGRPAAREVPPTIAPTSPPEDDDEAEIAAAIAVGLAHFRSLDLCRSGLGQALEAGRGPWWSVGKERHG